HSIYSLSDVEKIDNFKDEIIQIHHAIDNKKIIECIYRKKPRKLYPLQIKNFDGYWYLVCFDTNYKDIRKYHLNSISDIEEQETNYKFDSAIIEKFDDAINAYFKPELTPIRIELFLDKDVSKYFKRKPISKTQRIIKKYEDNSCAIELSVTDFMEIIPTIQRFLPHIGVIEPQELKEIIKKNLQTYMKNFD
ncbi:MAG: WYL domain-containing protein, partial [Epsilonproteobacteria bacterium]|nr:WYL domain-containing protein [Campylobacterota bacterium]